MNSIAGKSTGIALLMAAALIAALFAMGVFSAGTVGAHGCLDSNGDGVVNDLDEPLHSDGTDACGTDGDNTNAATALTPNAEHDPAHNGIIRNESVELSDYAPGATGVIMTVKFDVTVPSGDATDRDLTVTIPGSTETEAVFNEFIGLAEDNVSITQNDKDIEDVDAADIEVNAGAGTIILDTDENDTGADEYTAVHPIVVTITGLTNPTKNGPFPVSIAQGASSTTNVADTTVNVIPVNMAAGDVTVPGKVVELNIEANIAVAVRDKIVIDLTDFGVPPSIDKDDVIITDVTEAAVNTVVLIPGSPASVSVSGNKVTLTFGDLNGPDVTDPAGTSIAMDATQSETSHNTVITFLTEAGVALPSKSGTFDIGVETDRRAADNRTAEMTAGELINRVITERTVTVDPDDGKRGTEVTITGKGFSGSRARVMITDSDGDERTINSNVAISGGTFSLTVDTAAKDSEDDDYFGIGDSKINATDNDDESDATDATYSMTPSFTFSPESPAQSTTLTITLKDISGRPTSASFTGPHEANDIDSAAASGDTTMTKWKFTVPEKVAAGENKLTVMVDSKTLTATVNIAVNELTVTPTTVVPRQEISIDGDGFTSDAGDERNDPKNVVPASKSTLSYVTVGGKDAQNSEQPVNNNGNISFNIKVPDDVQPGSRKVQVKDAGGRIGEATITVAEPAITLDPAESLVGSEVTVSGTGFPANDLVLIKYASNTVDTAATSSTGTFEQTITIPSGNDPGAKVDIEAVAQVQVADTKASADAEHKLPDATITLSPAEVTAGGSLTINGASYQGFRQISLIEIGGNTVTPVPAPSTDKWGAFSATVQVPQLTPGRYGVSVRVGEDPGVTATEFLQVVTEVVVVPTATDEVFADLLGSGRLSRVWYLDRANQEWIFYDPRPQFVERGLNELTDLPARPTVVTLIITEGENLEFEGETLYPGTNPIPLN